MEIRVSVQKEWDGLSFGLGLEQTWVGSTDPPTHTHIYIYIYIIYISLKTTSLTSASRQNYPICGDIRLYVGVILRSFVM